MLTKNNFGVQANEIVGGRLLKENKNVNVETCYYKIFHMIPAYFMQSMVFKTVPSIWIIPISLYEK